ncbi:chitobiase/beta-hexosaminidase C-terminal domain-containing protein [bacterium]|nr:chitobiase/beta-hexosaminidase C-terminal domain-containing protein [bacterium]
MKIACLALFALSTVLSAGPRAFYQESTWQPRAHPSLEDLLGDEFHPAPPPLSRPVTYDTPGFAAARLHPAPATGVHPRVLVTPDDVAAIRARVAMGDAASPEFRALWTRVRASGSAFSALVAQDDTLGRALAAKFVGRLQSLEPKLDRLDAQPDRQSLWSAERSLVASSDPDPPHEIWTLLDYDYLHGWLTPDERALTERIVTRLVKDRFSNFLAEPDHFMINNHKGFGMEFIRLMLLIEGKAGFPEETFRKSARKARAMLDWYLSPDGMCYESIKGWLNVSAFVAVGRRDRDFLRHDHLVAKLRYFQSTLRWENGRWIIREEMRASAFHVIWLMRFLYPEDRSFDLLYHATLSTHPFLTDANARWPDPVGISPELLLLFAGGGPGDDRAGRAADWNSQAAIDSLKLPITWKDDLRGYVEARNSWEIGDLHLGFVNKQDFYYGGHEGSEANRITLWKDGVNWLRDEDLLAVKATGLQNMLTIDGRGLSWPPVPGVWLGVHEGPHGISAAGDARLAYSFGKVMQVHPLGSASGKLPYYAPFTEGNFDLSRDLQVAFHPGTVKWNDGYAHTDYGPWSGETRLVESYKTNNPVEQADRTVHLARGAHPYVLLLDDARKSDGNAHLFEASFNLPNGVVVVDAKTTEIQFQNVEPSERRESEFLLAPADVRIDPKTGRPAPEKGDPLMLVRVLHRNSDYGYPAPRVQVLPGRPEQPFNRFSQLVVPAISRSPEFRILFYPHRHGDPLPVTAWNLDRTELSVTLGSQHDVYQFAKTDGGRTVFDFTRDGALGLPNTAGPARPVLVVRGERYDAYALRETRREGETPVYPFSETIEVAFERAAGAAEIRYTLDGSEPTASSSRFESPFVIGDNATLRARVFDPAWPGENRRSAELAARFKLTPEAVGLSRPPDSKDGLLARVYEINTKLWDDRGFFRADKVMLPDLDKATPLVTAAASDGFALPHAVPSAPISEQTKGFYRFTGFFEAPVAGAYTFALDSCGPVLLNVGGQDAVAETGVFHQQQALRKGTVMLGAGWHPLELIVTDPLFWNLATTGVMPFSVTVRGPDDSGFTVVSPARLAAVLPAGVGPASPEIVWKDATPSPGSFEPGVIRSSFEREGLTRQTDYLEIDGLTPRRQEIANVLTDNTNPAQVAVYDGWFKAPVDGIYTFQLPSRRAEFVHLGGFRSAYQSQLRVSGEVVVQRGVAGRVAPGRIGLKAGWHPVSLRLGSSPADLMVTYPDGQTVRLDAHRLHRPAGRTLLAPSPDAALIARLDFAKWDGKTGVIPLDDRCRVWTASFAKAMELDGRNALVSPPVVATGGPESVDINLTRSVGRVPLKLHFLKMRDPEFTVGLWFRSDSGEGILFGKSGLTAFGKSYRTITARVGGGKLLADPGPLSGGEIEPGRWHHAVLIATPMRLALHLDGILIDEGPGKPGLTTDSFDFLPDHPGALAGVTIHNRELSAAEIARWFAAENP